MRVWASGLKSGSVGLLCTLCLTLAAVRPLAAATYEEDAVKAAFLYRFAAYVEWPQRDATDAPFTIAVLGSDGVATQLERLLPGLKIQNRSAQVRRLGALTDLNDAQILYVAQGQSVSARVLAEKSASHPILIVTDEARGLSDGGTINFIHVGRNLRFEISLTAAERGGLKIDSGLLAVATRVERNGS